MATRRKVSNLLGLAVLSYLTRGADAPLRAGATLQTNNDARSIKFNQGSLYMVVDQLVKAGFIVEHETARDGRRPERTAYTLTEAGRQEQRDWLRDLVAETQYEYPQFVAALSLIAALGPADTVELLNRRLGRLAARQGEVRAHIDEALAAGLHPLFLVDEAYRLELLGADSGLRRAAHRPDHQPSDRVGSGLGRLP